MPAGIDMKTDMQRAAQIFELWRLCRKTCCRRARACRGDAGVCCALLSEWYEAMESKDKRDSFEEAIQRLREQSA